MPTDRRTFIRTVAAGATLAATRSAFSVESDRSTRPNIILCMADDQGWGDMAYYGHPVLQTPNFDDMAATGLRFDHFYAAHPVCSPTRGSCLTGRHPNRFGCFSWGYTLRPQEITVARALKSAGYRTAHFGKWHVGSVQDGSPVSPGAVGFDEWFSAPNFYDNDAILSREGTAVQTQGESSMVTVDAALEFINKHADSPDPFLALVWFGSPHNPHRAAEEDLALYPDEEEEVANFYGEITGMDRAVGKLRSELRAMGIADDTLLWYCSDNGGLPKLGSCGGRGHKGQVYEGGLRVPAILEWPSRYPEHRVVDVPGNTSDFYPTLLDIAGVQMEGQPPLDGISLVPLLDGEMASRPAPMGFWHNPVPGQPVRSHEWMTELLEAQAAGRPDPADPERLHLDAAEINQQYTTGDYPGHAAWLDWPWKLHRKQRDDGTVKTELYNLAEDPNEETDLAADRPDRVAAMQPGFDAWLASVVNSLNGADY